MKGITAQQSVQVNGIAAQACASWLTYMLRRRYWYICWADTSWLTIHLPLGRTYYDGGTDTYICWANTSWLTIHLHLPLGRTYMLRRRYISWADNTHILRRSRIAYTFYLGEHHLGGATRTLPTWADVSFGNTLLAGRWYLSRRTCLPGRTTLLVACVICTANRVKQAKRHEYCHGYLPAMYTYRGVMRGLWVQ